MRIQVGELYARCPYCGSAEFVEAEDAPAPPVEVACASCGGFASHKLLVQQARLESASPAQQSQDDRSGS